MTNSPAQNRVRAALPRGLVDRAPADIAAAEAMMAKIRSVYALYGFEAVETPFIEYTEALGKFLPDQDRPNEGVFSFKDDDEQWLSLRYDLTAPLARYVAENYDRLPKPYRSYRAGWVFRNEKPGPGRYRQFMQFDADTVGAASVAADAEICMMAADCLEALGIQRGDYVVKVNNRKVLDGLMTSIGVDDPGQRVKVFRAVDTYDRLGIDGVRERLGGGRKDQSGDLTEGAGLSDKQINALLDPMRRDVDSVMRENGITDEKVQKTVRSAIGELTAIGRRFMADKIQGKDVNIDIDEKIGLSQTQIGLIEQYLGTVRNIGKLDIPGHVPFQLSEVSTHTNVEIDDYLVLDFFKDKFGPIHPAWEGITELFEILSLVRSAGYQGDRIRIDPTVVRGLEYYTGPVFEAELTFEVKDEAGRPVRFGSVGGGGRYDGLVARFREEPVPATGFSIGVSRLLAALRAIDSPIVKAAETSGPVVVLALDRDEKSMAGTQRLVAALRAAGIAAEMYLGQAGMNAQLKYADKRMSRVAVIQGSNERDAPGGPLVAIRDLKLGAELAKSTKDRADYLELRQRAQFTAPEAELVERVREVLARG